MSDRNSPILGKLTSDPMRFYVLVGFLTVVFLLGGGSRDDIQSLVILRPLAVIFCAYALLVGRIGQFKSLGLPLVLLLMLMALMILQLVPLPPNIWTSLPQREIYAEMGGAIGIASDLWRPLTLSPSRTLNSLFSLFVPLAAMLLFAIQDKSRIRDLFLTLFLLGTASAVLGLAQLAGPDRGGLYFYQITNNGLPVGLFANRNHQAAMLASSMIMAAWYFRSFDWTRGHPRFFGYLALAAILVNIMLIFLTGSRAGLFLGFLALAAVFYFLQWQKGGRSPSSTSRFAGKKGLLWYFGPVVVLIAALPVIFSRSFALDRLLGRDLLDDRRADILPVLANMTKDYFPFGSGFGSFEYIFRRYETIEIIGPRYFNHAHNDFIQFVIEGGIFAALLLLVFGIWVFRKSWIAMTEKIGASSAVRKLAVFLLTVFAVASIVDYPLRTPSIMALVAICCCVLARPQNSSSSIDTVHRKSRTRQ